MSNPDDRGVDDHKVENHVRVYVAYTPEGWVIDPATVDGAPLFGIDGGPECDTDHDHDDVTDEERVAWEAEHAAAEDDPLPDAYQLTLLLVEALRNSGAPIHLIGHCLACGDLLTEARMRSDEWQSSGHCAPCLNGEIR